MNKISLILILCFISPVFADPYTDQFKGKRDPTWQEIHKYFARMYLQETGSLPTVNSTYKDKQSIKFEGASFVIGYEDRKFLLSSSHLLSGKNKQATFNTVRHDSLQSSGTIDLDSKDFLNCADDDVYIHEIFDNSLQVPNFGEYEPSQNKFIVKGTNNSPRGVYLIEEFSIEEESWQNKNQRPLLKLASGEVYSYVQMGNMYDFSCNMFPSSPETYDGNAILIPKNYHLYADSIRNPQYEIKPFVQRIFNRFGLWTMMELVETGDCIVDMKTPLRKDEQAKSSLLSSTLIVPARVRQGMSGSPLLISNDLKKAEYEIKGIVSAHHRSFQTTHVVSQKRMMGCFNLFLKGDRGTIGSTIYKYSSDFGTLYRKSQNYSEINPIKVSTGTGTLGDVGHGTLGDVGNGTLGDLGHGTLGDVGKASYIPVNLPLLGVLKGKEHVLGFKDAGDELIYLANWESLELLKQKKLKEVVYNDELDLYQVLDHKFKERKDEGKNAKNMDLSITAEIEKDKDSYKLVLEGKYYLKKLDKDLSFEKEIKLPRKLKDLRPLISVKINEDDITNWFNSYEGGEVLHLDFTSFYFTNMERVYQEDRKDIHKPKLFISMQFREQRKGSIPVEVVWPWD